MNPPLVIMRKLCSPDCFILWSRLKQGISTILRILRGINELPPYKYEKA